MITFIRDKEQNVQVGIFYVSLLCLVSFTQTIIGQNFFFTQITSGIRIRSALMNAVYRKSFKLTASARKTVSIGQMTNLITNNAADIDHTLINLNEMISIPFNVSILIYMLWKYLGMASLAGLYYIFVSM